LEYHSIRGEIERFLLSRRCESWVLLYADEQAARQSVAVRRTTPLSASQQDDDAAVTGRVAIA